jgi:DNA mismatch endonuclease (patch repair protein)
MAAVRRQDTKPELTLRSALHKNGLRYRLHRANLPGTPDIVFVNARVAIFVHGCFWHRHGGCRRATTPASRADFWQEKFRRNIQRDRSAQGALRAEGWAVLVVWECELRFNEAVSQCTRRILSVVEKKSRASAIKVVAKRNARREPLQRNRRI